MKEETKMFLIYAIFILLMTIICSSCDKKVNSGNKCTHSAENSIEYSDLDNTLLENNLPVFNIGIVFHVFVTDEYLLQPEQIVEAISTNNIWWEKGFKDFLVFNIDNMFIYRTDYFDIGNYADDYGLISKMCDNRDEDDVINIYVVPGNGQLNGFTRMPILGLDLSDPKDNRIFISHEAFMNGSTLTHELGHFFGLKDDLEACNNFMSYYLCRDEFFLEQKDIMFNVATIGREYLIR